MDEELTGRVAELYGRTSQTRVEVVRAIAVGEYETAISIADQALGELDWWASELAEDADFQEMLPLVALAFALIGDLTVARVAAGKPEDVDSLNPHLFLSRYFGSELEMAARRCPHGRATYTAYCLARPPCPPPT